MPVRVPPSGPLDAKIVIVGEAPGVNEEQSLQPFVGTSGMELTKMLHEAGIPRTACYITNVVKTRPPGNDIGHYYFDKSRRKPRPELVNGMLEVRKEIEQVNPRVVIALGETALWATTTKRGITAWRGSMIDIGSRIVIPTYHPAAILRQWDWRPIAVHDLRRAREVLERGITTPEYRFTIRPAFNTAMSILADIRAHLAAYDARGAHEQNTPAGYPLAIDIETRGGHIACVGIAWSKHDALCIPLMCVERAEGYWSLDEEFAMVSRLIEIFTHPAARLIFQNGLYDVQYFIRYWGLWPQVADDTMLAQHVCFPGLPKGLDFLSSMYCDYHLFWKHEGKDWDSKTPEDQLWVYNCKDAVITYEVNEVLSGLVDKFGLREQYNFQMSMYKPVLQMMLRGVKIDMATRQKMFLELEDARVARETFINTAVGYPLNINSPKQMKAFFYDEMGLAEIRNRKTKKPTADDDALKKFALREPLLAPICQRIADCRSIKVFQSTFIQAELDPDKRIRCSFNIGGTETYRFASSANAFGTGTNLQNVPRGEEEEEGTFTLPKVRKLFIPDSGMLIGDVDLAGADAQVVAWEANDNKLKQMFRERIKIHAVNAKLIYGSAAGADGKREPYYTRTKMGVHASNYGASARTVAAAIGITVAEADHFQRIWFGEHPEIKRWHERIVHTLALTRSVRNKFGYRRIYFDRAESILPEALAWIPQSTVACAINRAMVSICNKLPAVELLLQVHDSLVFQIPVTQADDLIPKVLNEIQQIVIPYDDPLVIPAGVKSSQVSWGDAK